MTRVLVALVLSAPLMALAASDYAAWAKKNPDGSWTQAAEAAVMSSSLSAHTPADITKFCPHYEKLESADRARFWVGLLSAMARPESDFDPEKTFKENFKDRKGEYVISRGLLQLSQESANGYGCKIEKPEALHAPATNLSCAVKIIDRWVTRDGVIASYKADKKNLGGGRYWSVLRESNGFLPEISQFTQSLSVCKAQV